MGENLALEDPGVGGAAASSCNGAPRLLPAFRENTLRSFLSAAAAGATFVEFDVQVMRRAARWVGEVAAAHVLPAAEQPPPPGLHPPPHTHTVPPYCK